MTNNRDLWIFSEKEKMPTLNFGHIQFSILAFISAFLPTLNGLSFTCPGDGYYGDPDDCGAYYLCSSGTSTALKYKCGEGLLWDRERKLCDWAENVKCGIESTDTAELPPPVVNLGDNTVDNNDVDNNNIDRDPDLDIFQPISPRTTQEPIKNHCQQKEDGKYPNLAKKCRQYYACSDGEMIQLKMCDEGTVFDVQRLSCERPVYVAPPCGSALYSLTDYTKGKNHASIRELASSIVTLVSAIWIISSM